MNQIKKYETNNLNFSNNRVKIKDELVYLINTLNLVIKSYYKITKKIILQSKEEIKSKSCLLYINSIEKQFYIFIQNAKDIYNKMKYTKRKRLISQENINKLNDYSNNNCLHYPNSETFGNNFKQILDETHFKKINYNSPKTNSNFNINYINYNNYMNRYNIESQTTKYSHNPMKNMIKFNNSKINYSVNNTNKNNILPKKLDLSKIVHKDSNKEEILKNILFLLKKIL